jgi:23S rRNA (guanosine2251-2'-O)-methyltransferase
MIKKASFYIYGKKPVEEQLQKNPGNIIRIFISDSMKGSDHDFEVFRSLAKEHRIPLNPISRAKIKEYAGDVNDQGVIALLRGAEYLDFESWAENLDLDSNPSVLVLDRIEDTHNYGALLRTAAAVGVAGVIVAKDHQAPVNGTVFKTSAGAAVRVPIIQVSNINQSIEKLKRLKFWIAAIDMDDDSKRETIWDQSFDTPMAFVLGSEGHGIAVKTREHSDFVLSIPMENGVDSLNVSVAGAIVLYEWKRQKNKG